MLHHYHQHNPLNICLGPFISKLVKSLCPMGDGPEDELEEPKVFDDSNLSRSIGVLEDMQRAREKAESSRRSRDEARQISKLAARGYTVSAGSQPGTPFSEASVQPETSAPTATPSSKQIKGKPISSLLEAIFRELSQLTAASQRHTEILEALQSRFPAPAVSEEHATNESPATPSAERQRKEAEAFAKGAMTTPPLNKDQDLSESSGV